MYFASKKLKRLKIACIAAVVFFVAAGFGTWAVFGGGLSFIKGGDGEQALQFRDLKALSFKDYDGNTVELARFKGEALVLNAWASWSPYSAEELAYFAEAKRALGGDITIIAVNRAEPSVIAKDFSDKLGLYRGVLLLLDHDDSFYKSIGGYAMPETLFIDSKGKIRAHKRGPMTEDDIMHEAGKLLADV